MFWKPSAARTLTGWAFWRMLTGLARPVAARSDIAAVERKPFMVNSRCKSFLSKECEKVRTKKGVCMFE